MALRLKEPRKDEVWAVDKYGSMGHVFLHSRGFIRRNLLLLPSYKYILFWVTRAPSPVSLPALVASWQLPFGPCPSLG